MILKDILNDFIRSERFLMIVEMRERLHLF